MSARTLLIPSLIALSLVMSTGITLAQTIDCDATRIAWKNDIRYRNDPAFRAYVDSCNCSNGNNRPPVCSSAPTFSPSGKGLNPSQQIAMGIVGAMINSVFSGMFDDLFSSPSRDNVYQKQLQQQQEAKKQAEIEAWKKAQEKALQDALIEQKKRKERGEALMAQMGGGLTGGGKELKPMALAGGTNTGPDKGLKIIGVDDFRSSKGNDMAQLLCASYLSTRAMEESRKGNDEDARFFNEQAEKVMSGGTADVPCVNPQMPEVPMPKGQAKQGMDPQVFAGIIRDFNIKLKDLQNIEKDIKKLRKEKEIIKDNLKQIDVKIDEIKNKPPSQKQEEQSQEEDLLLQQAIAARSDAENQLNSAEKNEQALIDKAKTLAKDMEDSYRFIQQQK